MKHTAALALLVIALLVPCAGANEFGMSMERMGANIEYLSRDALGGRAPGSEGEKLTIAYVTQKFEEMGYAPGNPNGTFVQEVPLIGITSTNRPNLRIVTVDGDYERDLTYGPEFMGWTLRQRPSSQVRDRELVFVGYGTVAPEYEWDDFKGMDVRDKIIVMLVGDPPTEDQTLFGGKAMTYYGRWTYKFEKAAELGAAGAIVIHTAAAAGYPWDIVENSWQGEQFDIVRVDEGMSRCAMESWITEAVARELFEVCGRSFDDAFAAAATREFTPFPLGLRASFEIHNLTRRVTSHNIVALLPGNDETLGEERIIYTAHWDHLGIGHAVDGDSVYNGSLDNASGVAGLLEIAAAFTQKHDELRRSVLMILTTAEESGLLGAKHYAEYPLYPLARTVASINIDGINVWGRTEDMVVVGFGQSDLDRLLEEAVATMGRHILPDSEPEKGYYYRSDHFPFAARGVPALYADSGIEFRGRPEGWGMERRNEYVRERYHKPQDEYDPSWDLSGAIEDMTALFLVGYRLAAGDDYPRWSDTSEFKRVREESLRGSK